jgi:hypothetical protein
MPPRHSQGCLKPLQARDWLLETNRKSSNTSLRHADAHVCSSAILRRLRAVLAEPRTVALDGMPPHVGPDGPSLQAGESPQGGSADCQCGRIRSHSARRVHNRTRKGARRRHTCLFTPNLLLFGLPPSRGCRRGDGGIVLGERVSRS